MLKTINQLILVTTIGKCFFSNFFKYEIILVTTIGKCFCSNFLKYEIHCKSYCCLYSASLKNQKFINLFSGNQFFCYRLFICHQKGYTILMTNISS